MDAAPLTANLRYGPAYRTVQPVTFFDYSDYGGLPGAVEMCSGLGACRKTLEGTMCPSYMATREEAHSTRGRANVLRLAMAGRIGEAGLGDEGVREVLDLCLECRACKAECPVGVDVARFKSEFLADYWRRHGTSLRARMLGHIHDLSRWGSRLRAAVEHRARGARRVRWLNERAARHRLSSCAAGMERRRRSRASSADGVRVRLASGPGRGKTSKRAVAIFNDTFTNYYSPAIGMAGLDVLEIAGFEVELAPNLVLRRDRSFRRACSGPPGARPRLSTDRSVSTGRARTADRVLRTQLSLGDS